MKKKIFHNWGLKIASLLLAVGLWFLAAQINDPSQTVTFSNIPVRLTNTSLFERENKVYEVLDNTDVVRVTIRAPRSVTKDLRQSDIVAVADVSKLTDINTIAISYSIQGISSTGYDTIRGDHETVRLNVEDKASRQIRVQSQTVGEVAEGYQVMSAALDLNMIEVTGPVSAVSKISYATVEVDVSGASANMSLNVEPQFYDADKNLLDLPSVVKNVSHIHVDVEILAVKEVPVLLNVTGTPAEGYRTTGEVTCDPQTVKIAGTVSALASVNSISVPADALDITGAAEDLVTTVNLQNYLKDNIRLADSGFNGRAAVTVNIEPVVERRLTLGTGNVSIVNVPQNFAAEPVAPEGGYRLTIIGLEDDVSQVSAESVAVQVDVGAWLERERIREPEDGDYEIPAVVVLPDDVEQKEEMTVMVRLMKMEEI